MRSIRFLVVELGAQEGISQKETTTGQRNADLGGGKKCNPQTSQILGVANDFTLFWGSKPRKQNFLKKFCFQFVSKVHIPGANIHTHLCIFVSLRDEIYTQLCV